MPERQTGQNRRGAGSGLFFFFCRIPAVNMTHWKRGCGNLPGEFVRQARNRNMHMWGVWVQTMTAFEDKQGYVIVAEQKISGIVKS